MKVRIEATQEEFDTKRDELVRVLTKSENALKPRRSVLKAQNEILDFWDKKFHAMVTNLKEEIDQILSE